MTNQQLPSGLVLPRGVRIITPDELAAETPPPEQGPPCAKCGIPLPPLDEEVKRMIAANPGAEVYLAHEVCPDAPVVKPEGRFFEVHVRIVELTERETGGLGDGPNPEIVAEELMSFVAGHRAPNLDEAMRPLALALGEKWEVAEKQARIADAEAIADQLGLAP